MEKGQPITYHPNNFKKGWSVLLYNDSRHAFPTVIKALMHIGYSPLAAKILAFAINDRGMEVIKNTGENVHEARIIESFMRANRFQVEIMHH